MINNSTIDNYSIDNKYKLQSTTPSGKTIIAYITTDGNVWKEGYGWLSINGVGECQIHREKETHYCWYILVHKVMAELWLLNPSNKKSVVFKDNNNTNRTLSNLAWSNTRQYIIGKKFGKLTIIDDIDMNRVRCQCDCGKISEPFLNAIKSGRTISCGCALSESSRNRILDRNTTHGLSHHPIYDVWNNMMTRCYNQKSNSWKDYGGRGIIVIQEWHNPEIFILWAIQNNYSPDLQIDRINNSGNYEPSNCRFITCLENLRNTRRNINLTYNDTTLCRTEWALRLNVSSDHIIYHMNKGYTFEEYVNKFHADKLF